MKSSPPKKVIKRNPKTDCSIQVGISTSKSTTDLGALLGRRALEIEYSRVHTANTYAGGGR
jgi:hypothetical protein